MKKRYVTRKPFTDAWLIYDREKGQWVKEHGNALYFHKRTAALKKARALEIKPCCPCPSEEAPNFTRVYRNKAGEIVNHGICRCKCHKLDE